MTGAAMPPTGYSTAITSSRPVSTLLSFTKRDVLDHRDHGQRSGQDGGRALADPDGMPTTSAISSHVIHFSINSRLRDTSTAIPPIDQDRQRDPHEEHGSGVEVDVQRTEVDVERHPPIEMKDPQVVVDEHHVARAPGKLRFRTR